MRWTEEDYAAWQRRQDQPGASKARKPSAVRLPAPTEHDDQVVIFQWAAANEGRWPELRLLAAIPNGGARSVVTGALLKAEGVRAGYPDMVLPCQRTGPDGRVYGALFVELKRVDHSNAPSPLQKAYIDMLRAEGNHVIVAYGANEAITAIAYYLALGR